MNAESNQFTFAENFLDFRYISDTEGRLEDTGDRIEIVISPIPIKPIAIFMACVAVAVVLLIFWLEDDAKMKLGLSIGAVFAAVLFVGMLWGTNCLLLLAKLPSIDKASEELTLPSGTKIGKDEIEFFRQFECKTPISFRLVVTTVVTSRQNQQYAVCAEIGNFKTAKIGNEIAEYFDAETKRWPDVVKKRELLQKFGLA